MKNKISLIIYSLIALVPAVFIIIAFFGPEKDSAISLNGLDPFGFDDVKVTKKYDESEERLRKKREKFKKAVEDTYKESTSKSYVTYSKDLSSRTIVDFEKGEVTIELIVDEEDPKYDSYDSKYDLDLDKQFANRDKIHKNLLSINTISSTCFGLPKLSKASIADLIDLPVNNTSSIRTTLFPSTETFISNF